MRGVDPLSLGGQRGLPWILFKNLCHGERFLSHIEAKLFILYDRFQHSNIFIIAHDVNGTGMHLTLIVFLVIRCVICLIYDFYTSQESSLVFAVVLLLLRLCR